jgi:integrase
MATARYDSMNAALREHEERVGVEHHRGRSYHAFRRALATLLGEVLGPKFAAEWIGDTLQATIQHYIKETPTAKAAAVQVLLRMFGEAGLPAEPPANRDPAAGGEKTEAASA